MPIIRQIFIHSLNIFVFRNKFLLNLLFDVHFLNSTTPCRKYMLSLDFDTLHEKYTR